MIANQTVTCEECRDGSCKRCKAHKRRQQRKAKADAMRSLGLTPVNGATSGRTYWE